MVTVLPGPPSDQTFAQYTKLSPIREIPDHATFRGKGVNTGMVRQTWGLSPFGPV